ncbi:hypothetical protein HDZ31DRAFT_48448 [Schizophyllum fasciatum]
MSAPQTTYTLNIHDQSPVFQFAPYMSNSTDDGWKVIYQDSPDSTYDHTHTANNLGHGRSHHLSNSSGATATIEFYGSACVLYGSADAGSYKTKLDDEGDQDGAPNESDGTLVAYNGLDYGKHRMTLTVSGGKTVDIMSVDVVLGLGEQGAHFNSTNIDAVKVSGGGSQSEQNPFFSTSGATFHTDHDAAGYPRLDTNGLGTISFTFTKASIIQILGTMNYDHGRYSVSISPSVGVTDETRTFNATSLWFAYDTILFYESGLDRSETYQINMKNLDQDLYMDLHQIVLIDAIPKESSSAMSVGAIAGIAVGVVIAVLLAVIAALFWRRRRNKRMSGSFDLDASGYGIHQSGFSSTHMPPHAVTISPYEAIPTPASSEFNPASLYMASSASAASGVAPPPINQYGQIPPSKYASMRASDINTDASARSRSNSGDLLSAPTASSSSGSDGTMVKGRRTPDLRVSPAPRQEVDAGPLALQPADEPEVLPPGYNPAWAGAPPAIPNTR